MSLKANELRPSRGSTKTRTRAGRGNSAGRGTYAGRGVKGQNSRSGGGVRPGFEGGQLPLIRRMHTLKGFNNKWRTEYQPVNLGTLSEHFDSGDTVTPESMLAAGVLRHLRQPVKILAGGDLVHPLNISTHKISAAARQKVESAGGQISLLDAKSGQEVLSSTESSESD